MVPKPGTETDGMSFHGRQICHWQPEVPTGRNVLWQTPLFLIVLCSSADNDAGEPRGHDEGGGGADFPPDAGRHSSRWLPLRFNSARGALVQWQQLPPFSLHAGARGATWE